MYSDLYLFTRSLSSSSVAVATEELGEIGDKELGVEAPSDGRAEGRLGTCNCCADTIDNAKLMEMHSTIAALIFCWTKYLVMTLNYPSRP
jgi:hypothetical protein